MTGHVISLTGTLETRVRQQFLALPLKPIGSGLMSSPLGKTKIGHCLCYRHLHVE